MKANKKEKITDLPFEASCVASGCGWFCAGSEQGGYFAAFKITDVPPRSSTYDYIGDHARPPIRIEKWDNLIINSISIHELPAHDVSGPEIVALVTNNNSNVRMYSLSHEELLLKLEFEFAMNHASISPDGKYFIIVGDLNRAYIGKSILEKENDASRIKSSAGKPVRSTWTHLREINLHKHPAASKTGYFTTAWSSNNRLCATASENGYITLLDVSCFEDLEADPVLRVMPSSAPTHSSGPGSVRSMSFLPSIYDQLLWVEDNGRACLADLRDGLLTRQNIDLDASSRDVTLVQPEDFTDLPELEAVDHASDIDVMTSRQRSHWLAEETPTSTEAIMEGLTDQERHIIDGIRLTRTREERIAAQRRLRLHTSNAPPIPMSIRYDESSESVMPSFAQSVLRVIQTEAGQSRAMSAAELAVLSSTSTSRQREEDRQMDWQSLLDVYDTLHDEPRPGRDDTHDQDEDGGSQATARGEPSPRPLRQTPSTQRRIASRVARIRAARAAGIDSLVPEIVEDNSSPWPSEPAPVLPPPVTVSPRTWVRTRAGITSYTMSARWDNADPRGTTGHVISPDGKTM